MEGKITTFSCPDKASRLLVIQGIILKPLVMNPLFSELQQIHFLCWTRRHYQVASHVRRKHKANNYSFFLFGCKLFVNRSKKSLRNIILYLLETHFCSFRKSPFWTFSSKDFVNFLSMKYWQHLRFISYYFPFKKIYTLNGSLVFDDW